MRKKGKWADGSSKYILERYEGETLETKTLPKPKDLWDIIRLAGNTKKTSCSPNENKENKGENFAYSLLTEPESKEKKRTASPEEIKSLWDLTK